MIPEKDHEKICEGGKPLKHIEPAEKDILCQRMGIFLTPDSSELTILCEELGIIDDYIIEE